MERLLADAEKITGIHYDISNLDDVYKAIHVIQGELGITGTTAKEASETLQGSAASMKAAFTNFLSGAGGIDEVITTVQTFANNLIPVIVEMAPKIINGLVQLLNAIIQQLPTLLKTLIPPLMDGLMAMLTSLLQILPDILNVLIESLTYIVQVLAEQLPILIPMIVDAILQLIPVLLDNIPLFVKAGWQLFIGLMNGIANAVPVILKNIPGIAKSILNAIKYGLSTVGNIGKQMIKGLWNGMSGLKDWVIGKVASMGKSILKGLKSVLGIHSPSTEFAMIGKFSVLGYTEALQDMSKDVDKQIASTFGISPQVTGSMQNSFSPNVQVYNNVNVEQDPLGQMVKTIKTYSGGSPNDYNYGAGV